MLEHTYLPQMCNHGGGVLGAMLITTSGLPDHILVAFSKKINKKKMHFLGPGMVYNTRSMDAVISCYFDFAGVCCAGMVI